MKRTVEISLHAIFLLLMALSILLYKERLFADASHYFFHSINSGWFHIEHGRIVLGIPQFITLIPYYLGFPFKYLVVFSSLSHELFYYGVFLLLFYRLQDHLAAMGLLLIHLIGQLWLYYSPMLEICYGAAFALLVYSILRQGKYRNELWLMLLLIAQWFAMSSHPENFILLVFILCYDYLQRGFQKRIHISMLFFLGIGLIVEWLTLSGYELTNFRNPMQEEASVLNLLQLSYLKDLSYLFWGYFPDLLLLLLISLFLLFYQQFFKKAFLFLATIGLVIVAVNHHATANDFGRYYESMYNPLVFLVVFVFVFEVGKRCYAGNKWKFAFTIAVLLIAVFRIAWIYEYGEPLRKRTDQMERLSDYAQGFRGDKLKIRRDQYHHSYSHLSWSYPIEHLIFSAIDGKAHSLSLITDYDWEYHENNKNLSDSTFLLRRHDLLPHDFLNPRFFQLSKGKYRDLNTVGRTEELKELKPQLSLELINLDQKNRTFPAGDTIENLVRIGNTSDIPLSSAKESGIFLSYHWFEEDGELHSWDGLRSLIKVDVIGTFEQNMQIAVPDKAGIYYLQADILLEGEMWYDLGEQHKIEVK